MAYLQSFRFIFVTILIVSIQLSHCSIHDHYDLRDHKHKHKPEYVTGLKDAVNYFTEFGYLENPQNDSMSMSMADLHDVIMDFQEVCSLKQTGILDEPTMKLMNTPRCANKDTVVVHHHRNHTHIEREPERFTLHGTKWMTNPISFRITQYSRQRISREMTDEVIALAFQLWQNEVDLEFVPSHFGPVDIEVKFVTRAHGDNYDFEGTYTLAHAFYPGTGLGGDVHFNDDVDWSSRKTLLYTALHEIGHSLGLRHSSIQNSVMFAHYIWAGDEVQLTSDDIAGIQELYGTKLKSGSGNNIPVKPPPRPRPTLPVTTTTTTTTDTPRRHHHHPQTPKFPTQTTTTTAPRQKPVPVPPSVDRTDTFQPQSEIEAIFWERRNSELCKNGIIDAITDLHNGTILVFRKDFILPVALSNNKLIAGRIQSIRQVFNGLLPSDIDAAFTRSTNDKSYYFKGDQYWRAVGTKIEHGYPKLISEHFPGIPNKLDAAFEWSNKHMYFFKGNEYWKFDPKTTPKVPPNYPLEISDQNWEGVPTSDLNAIIQLIGNSKVQGQGKEADRHNTYFFRNGRYWRFDENMGQVPKNASPPYPRDARIWFFGCVFDFDSDLSLL